MTKKVKRNKFKIKATFQSVDDSLILEASGECGRVAVFTDCNLSCNMQYMRCEFQGKAGNRVNNHLHNKYINQEGFLPECPSCLANLCKELKKGVFWKHVRA